ncbi:hypothetical protein WA171_006292 [Blastocystis sp. BT1]
MRCVHQCKSLIHNTARSDFSSRDSFPVIPATYPKDDLEYIPDGYTSQELCNLLLSNNLSIPDTDNLAFSLSNRPDATPEHVEVAIKALYKVNYYNEIIHLFRIILGKRSGFGFTTRTVELIFESILHKRQYSLLNTVWYICDQTMQKNWGVLSLYCHGLLASHRLPEARPFLDMLQRRAYSIPIANSHILLGLYEGRYYEECLRFFYGLTSLDPSFQLIKSPTAVFSVLKAAYQLRRYSEVLKLYEYILQHNITPNRSVVFIIAEIYEKGDFWRGEYERQMNVLRSYGIIPTETQQLAILAQARLPQFLKGGALLQDYSKQRNEALVQENKQGNYAVSLEKYYEPQRRLRLIGILNDIPLIGDGKQLVIRSIKNDTSLMKLLQSELYPPISFRVNVCILLYPDV